MKTLNRIAAAAVILLASSLSAQAATSTAIGEVSILGTDYEVSLLSDIDIDSQSFDKLKPTITFTNLSDAQAAANALMAKFGSSYNWNPTCIECEIGVRVAYGSDGANYDYVSVVNSFTYGPFHLPSSGANNFSFAQFTTAVPESDIGLMMLAGLSVIACRRRASKRLG